MTPQRIVLIEDSERYISELLGYIEDKLRIGQDSIRVLRTETEFYDAIPELEQNPPAIFIVDVMLPYKAVGEPDDNVPPAIREKAIEDKFYRAGIRCANSLLENSKLQRVPIILHSILERANMESDDKYPIPLAKNVTVCKKEANGHGIIQAAEQILKRAN